MGDATFTSLLVAFVSNTMILAGVPLLVATLVGLVVSIFQAVTQIQDQTLSQTAKIIAIALVFLSFGGALVSPLLTLSNDLFINFADFQR